MSNSSTATTSSDASDARAVLTVGDGNFSFSLAFARRFPRARLTASSFDSAAELATKYPEAPRICTQLRSLGARVLHRVDATQLRATLRQAGSGSNGDPEERFDVVVFNHPHCGEENVRRHKSLLSHFYASARELLAVGGEVRLTLAHGQPERWEALARACRAGLRLKQQVDDVDSDEAFGLAYERKRHQNGRSFHRVLLHGEKLEQQSTLFIFERDASEGSSSSGEQVAKEEVEKAGDAPAAVRSPVSPAAAVATPSRKRKAQDAALQQHQFACDTCEKSFKTAQGLKTHVHMVHELGGGGDAGGGAAKSAVLLPCGVCERTFKNEDAQRQHRLAKHGSDQLIQPDWYQKQQESSESAATTAPDAVDAASQPTLAQPLTCQICDLAYPSQAAFDEHWQELRPIEVVQRNCSRCTRSFDDERALRQHQNFCKATPVQEVKAEQQPGDKEAEDTRSE